MRWRGRAWKDWEQEEEEEEEEEERKQFSKRERDALDMGEVFVGCLQEERRAKKEIETD